jgi:hypothetical protein
MRCTIDSDRLDITQWVGKRQHLQTLINKEVYSRHLDDTLPFRLIMTSEQYEMLKSTPEFGKKGEWRYYKPEQRIYCTDYNCMEVIIKEN